MKRSFAARLRLAGCATMLAAMSAAVHVAHAVEYTPDPTWNGGQIGADNFAGGYDYRRGQKLVRMDNGDTIVAGVVPGVGDAAGHYKLGLVRYNAAGVRQTWSNAGDNGVYNDQYVVTPCVASAWCGDVKDVKGIYRYGDRIFVVADTEDFHLELGGGNPPLPLLIANPAVDVYVFGTDGALRGTANIDSDNYADDESRTVYGGGIAVYDNNMLPTTVTLVYAGLRIVDGVYYPRYARFKVESDSTLTSLTAPMQPAFGTRCSTGNCQFLDIALGGRTTATAAPRIYISGSRWHPGPGSGQIGWPAGWDAFVASVNPDGSPRTGFADQGLYTTEGIGTQSGGQKIAVSGGFGALTADEIFVVADVERDCRNGIAVLKLGQTGTTATTFGSNGRVIYGGSDATSTSCALGWLNQSVRSDYPTDIAYADGLVAVAGLNIYGPGVLCTVGQPCPEDNVDGEVAVIDANTGTIESWRGYAYSETPGGARSRHSGFWGIAAGDDGTFSVAGDVRYFNRDSVPANQRGRQMFATLRVAPRGDVIFANGFDG